jgi:hypothetical protein
MGPTVSPIAKKAKKKSSAKDRAQFAVTSRNRQLPSRVVHAA